MWWVTHIEGLPRQWWFNWISIVLNVHLNPYPLPFCADPDQNQNVKLYCVLHDNEKHMDIISRKKIKQLFTTRFRFLIKNVIFFSVYIIRQITQESFFLILRLFITFLYCHVFNFLMYVYGNVLLYKFTRTLYQVQLLVLKFSAWTNLKLIPNLQHSDQHINCNMKNVGPGPVTYCGTYNAHSTHTKCVFYQHWQNSC